MKNDPFCIYAKDVAKILGKSERTALRIIADIKFVLNRKPYQFLTIREFCEYAGFDYEEVMNKFFRKPPGRNNL
jgi:hypothetical protein